MMTKNDFFSQRKKTWENVTDGWTQNLYRPVLMSDKIYPVKEKRDSEFCLIADQFFSWSHKSRGICSDDPLIDLKWPLDYEKVVLTDMLTTYQKRVVHNCFIKNNVFEPLFRGMKLEFFWIFFPKINFRILWTQKIFLPVGFRDMQIF